MKKLLKQKLVFLFIATALFISCDDDNSYYGNGPEPYFSKLYSNKNLANEKYGILSLNYSDSPFYGVDVYLEMEDEEKGKLKFFGVFPGEKETVLENLLLTPTSTGYTFGGEAVTTKGTSYRYQGTLTNSDSEEKRNMNISLSDIKIPDNKLLAAGTFKTQNFKDSETNLFDDENFQFYNIYTMPVLLDWRIDIGAGERKLFMLDDADLSYMLQGILSNVIFLVLDELNFHPDGNITASYAGMPSDIPTFSYLSGFDPEDRLPLETSPINLIHYFVDGTTVYIRPNIEMIMRLIDSNKSDGTRAESSSILGDLGGILSGIVDAYPSLTRWFTEGIKFHLEDNDPNELDSTDGMNVYWQGDYKFYLDQDEFKPVIELLPTIWGLLDVDLSDLPIVGSMLGPVMDDIIASTQYTTQMKLGFYLKK